MSIWKEPKITFKQFSTYVNDEKHKVLLKRKWNTKTKSKVFLSELESHELSDILVLFLKECIKSYAYDSNDTDVNIKADELQNTSHLFSDWIFENKLSGIPMNDEDDYNKMKMTDIFSNNLLFKWIKEASLPLQTYIAQTEHNSTESQQAIAAKNKRMIEKHPSLAHLFSEQIVNSKHIKFNDFNQFLRDEDDKKFNQKQQKARKNIHQIRQSRVMLFFNHSDIGYETKKRCNIYKDIKLTEFLIEVSKGDLLGGKYADDKVVEILEPIKGFIHSKYLKEFDLDSAQWKFLQHQRSKTSTIDASLTLRINNEDLFLPPEENTENTHNENEDEKKLEEQSMKQKAESERSRILNKKKSKRTARDVVDLWCAAFNLHDCEILKECYALQVTSTQFVNQELNARDPVLQCLKQMFAVSNDVGLDVNNIILKDKTVILEFKTFGTRKEDANTSDSAQHEENIQNDNAHLLASHPTKYGLPQKVINGVGIFEVEKGEIVNQKLFWDQDQQWFSDMNVIKMPHSSTLSHFLYKNKLAPVLNLNDEIQTLQMKYRHHADHDNHVIYEMSDEMNEILALRGLNISDLREYHPRYKSNRQNKQKQLAQAIFWVAVGAMFVFIVPKYLNKRK